MCIVHCILLLIHVIIKLHSNYTQFVPNVHTAYMRIIERKPTCVYEDNFNT